MSIGPKEVSLRRCGTFRLKRLQRGFGGDKGLADGCSWLVLRDEDERLDNRGLSELSNG